MKKRVLMVGMTLGMMAAVLCGCSHSSASEKGWISTTAFTSQQSTDTPFQPSKDLTDQQSTDVVFQQSTDLTDQQGMDIVNTLQAYCKDYRQKDVVDGKQIIVTAPDFEKIVQSLYANGTPSHIDSALLQDKIKEHPEWTKDYTFTVATAEQEEIEKQFYDMVVYDMMMTAYKHLDYTIKEEN